jgi:hypothetical protein
MDLKIQHPTAGAVLFEDHQLQLAGGRDNVLSGGGDCVRFPAFAATCERQNSDAHRETAPSAALHVILLD